MYNKTGVFLRPSKKPLVITRLRKRVQDLNLKDFSEYIAILEGKDRNELEIFINSITTNETFFFRHTKQFNYLYETVLPDLCARKVSVIKVWSAACSTGEEPYSIAISLAEFLKNKRETDFKVYASDINTRVVKMSQQGQYGQRSLKNVPKSLLDNYFSLVKGDQRQTEVLYEVKSTLKQKVHFLQHNLKVPFEYKDLDVVFLRNVMIYFDQPAKQRAVELVEASLKPNGYFFISLSESLNDIQCSLRMISSGIYQKT
jgi:chemotaxis protein methyltransferase CheR